MQENGNMQMRWKIPSGLGGLLLISFLASTPTLHAQEDSVYSVNIIGVQKVDLPPANQLRMASMPFVAGSNTLIEIFGTNQLKQGSTPAACDRIRFWDASEQAYVSVAQAINGVFYYLSGEGWAPGYPEANDLAVEDGDSFWIVSASDAGSGRQLAMVGDIISEPTNSVPVVAGYQLLTYPFSCEMALSNTTLIACGATSASTPGGADRIRLWNSELQAYEGFALAPDNKWYKLSGNGWQIPYTVSTHVFTPGEGFFYWAQNPFTWAEPNPYPDAFGD